MSFGGRIVPVDAKMQNIDMHEISIGNMDIIRSATFSIPPQLFKHCVDVGNQCDKNWDDSVHETDNFLFQFPNPSGEQTEVN